jgi:formylglycine-generating enzyme required for sulfatase activity
MRYAIQLMAIGWLGIAVHQAGPAQAEAVLGPDQEFRECPDVCPEMVVLPSGEFIMGSPPGEAGRAKTEGPQRKVTIARPFAVGKYEVAFVEWDACVAHGGCTQTER